MSDALVYFCTIEGIAKASGSIKFCYPVKPDYASATLYVPCLAEPPSGASSEWAILANSVSVGRFRLVFRNEVRDVLDWWITRPVGVGNLAEALDASETVIDLLPGHSIADGDVIFVDRETIAVTTVVGDQITACSRGLFSTAAIHPEGSPIFATPPALTGREVIVYQTRREGGSVGNEEVILRGYVAGEMAAGIHWPGIDCVERFTTKKMNKTPCARQITQLASLGGGSFSGRVEPGNEWVGSTGMLGRFRADLGGGYLWLPEFDTVIAVEYDAATVGGVDFRYNTFVSSPVPIRGDLNGLFDVYAGAHTGELVCYDVALSDTALPYPAFGFTPDGGTFEASDHPVVIALNLLVSTEAGTNIAAGRTSYDRGTALAGIAGLGSAGSAGGYSMGIPIARVDQDQFELVKDLLGPIHASRFWLGVESETFEEAFRRLLGPFGYAIGTTRRGIYTIIGIADTYPDDTTTSLDGSNIVRAREIQHITQARPLDRIVLRTNPAPDGEALSSLTISEITARRYYPDTVGADLEYEKSPYADLDLDLYAYDMAAIRFRRMADRVATLDLTVGGADYDAPDLGSLVTVQDKAIRDPSTGTKNVQVSGIVTSCEVQRRPAENKITVALTATGKVGRICPSARVATDDAAGTMTFEDRDFSRATGTDDVGKFSVGQRIMLADSRGVWRSDVTATHPTYVLSIDSVTDTIEITNDNVTLGRFKTTAGANLTAAAGDIITLAEEEDASNSDRAKYAFMADGDVSTAAEFGFSARPPYVWGD